MQVLRISSSPSPSLTDVNFASKYSQKIQDYALTCVSFRRDKCNRQAALIRVETTKLFAWRAYLISPTNPHLFGVGTAFALGIEERGSSKVFFTLNRDSPTCNNKRIANHRRNDFGGHPA